jgi:hypothetical protein
LCVLLRVERLVFSEQPVAPRVRQRVALELDQLFDCLALTGWSGAERRGKSVGLAVVGRPVVEARVTPARPVRRHGIDLVEVGDHLVHRPMQTVQVQAVEAGFPTTR